MWFALVQIVLFFSPDSESMQFVPDVTGPNFAAIARHELEFLFITTLVDVLHNCSDAQMGIELLQR